MLIIMSLSLYSQQDAYWQKVDFDFGSGVKLIYFQNPRSFIVVTEKDEIYYYSYLDTIPQKIDFEIQPESIKDICITEENRIFLLTHNYRLFFKQDITSNNNWRQILSEIDSSEVNCIHRYDIYDNPDFYLEEITIGTKKNGIYTYNPKSSDWFLFDVPDSLEVTNFIRYSPYSYLSVNNGNYYIKNNYSDKFEKLNITSNIKKIAYPDFYIVYGKPFYLILTEDSNVYYKSQDELQKFTINENEKINYFAMHDYLEVCKYSINQKIPYYYSTLLGCESGNLYYQIDWTIGNVKFSKFSFLEGIQVMEFNCRLDPSLCLVGTKDGLYYNDISSSVEDNSHNPLQNQIYPQPASDKAKLNFTLPQSSLVSIKLYNALGIELQTIANTFFSEGLNSIPIDLSNFSDGVYFVVIDYQGERVVEKIVVRK